MNILRKNILLGAFACGLAAAASGAYADMPAPLMMGDHIPMGVHRGMPDAQSAEKMQEQWLKRMANLHEKLKLNTLQEEAWKTFLAAMSQVTVPTPITPAEMARLSVPERMEKGLALMKEHEKNMTARLAAVKTFYAMLSTDQQKIFNENFGKGRWQSMHH